MKYKYEITTVALWGIIIITTLFFRATQLFLLIWGRRICFA